MTTPHHPHTLAVHDHLATRGTFQQQRVRLFLKILIAFFVAFNLLGIVKYVTMYRAGMHQWLDAVRDGTLVFLVLTVLLAGTWLYVRLGQRSTGVLQIIDSAGTIVASGVLAMIIPFFPFAGSGELGMAFLLVLTLVVRAAVVPSTGGRTFVVGVLATVPLAATLWVRGSGADLATDPVVVLLGPMVATWGVIFSVATAVISRVIYGLQRELRALGSYQLVERLGKGGMGEVWRAEHKMLARPAAIKMIRADALVGAGDTHAAIERFEHEAQATAALTCPNTIHLFDFGHTDDGSFYYVMELLDGLDLDTLVKKHGPLRAARVAHLLGQICRSLHEAHEAGLIHRDIKPANIFLCHYGAELDFIKVLDFGLVKYHDEPVDTGITRDGVAVGTPAFMAPEAVMGEKEIDARADLYAVGCVGYWLLTGALVFEADSPTALLVKHASEEPVPPSQRTEIDIPATLEALIMACLAKDPAERPSSASHLRRALSGIGLSWTEEEAESWWQLHRPGHT